MFDALIAGGAALAGGLMGSDAAEKAADAQKSATETAIGTMQRQYDLNRQDMRPFTQAGHAGLARISHLLGIGPRVAQGQTYQQVAEPILKKYADSFGGGDFNAVPPEYRNAAYSEAEQAFNASQQGLSDSDYGSLNKQFTVGDFYNDPVTKLGLDYGEKAINNKLGALGMRKSGLMVKGLHDYAGTKAAESASRFYGDQDRVLNRLSGVTGMGQTSTNAVAGMGQNTAQNIAGMTSALGNARGAASIAKGNAWANAFNNIGNWWSGKQALDRILTNGGGIRGGMSATPYIGDYGWGNV